LFSLSLPPQHYFLSRRQSCVALVAPLSVCSCFERPRPCKAPFESDGCRPVPELIVRHPHLDQPSLAFLTPPRYRVPFPLRVIFVGFLALTILFLLPRGCFCLVFLPILSIIAGTRYCVSVRPILVPVRSRCIRVYIDSCLVFLLS